MKLYNLIIKKKSFPNFMILIEKIRFEKDNNKNNFVALNSQHQYHLTRTNVGRIKDKKNTTDAVFLIKMLPCDFIRKPDGYFGSFVGFCFEFNDSATICDSFFHVIDSVPQFYFIVVESFSVVANVDYDIIF